jgi:protein O-GlcNAc transferase
MLEMSIRTSVLADQPHVLLYPEIGLDSVTARLAGEKLAPVQCVAWGQPETSGMPTVNFFLSAALMEPDNAEWHYSERLVSLPNIGIFYTADERFSEHCPRQKMGVRDDATLFWCGQALYKYLPQYDDIFARIAAEVGNCQFLFIGFARSGAVTECFRSRLRHAFAARGLCVDRYCVILPPMSQECFLGTVRSSDIVLDSIGWSGGKSTLDALAETPIIVTYLGQKMRGRHTAAILARIGVIETIAVTFDEYVQIAVRLAREPSERSALRARIEAGRDRVMKDATAIRALEAFMVWAVAQLD